MSSWKKMTAVVDSNAQKFLSNKRFSREQRTFTWDWHFWNLAIACTPGLLLWAWLHQVEKKVLEEERIRLEVQEITGVSSRGYMVPTRKAREEARDMLRKGNTKGRDLLDAEAEGGGRAGASTRVTSEAQKTSATAGQDTLTLQRFLSHQRMLQQRLDAVEKKLGLESPTGSAEISSLDRIESAGEVLRSDTSPNDSGEANKDESFVLETMGRAASKAVGAATVVRTWVVDVGLPQGIELYRTARDWLAEDDIKSANASINVQNNQDGAANTSGDLLGVEPKETRRDNGQSAKSTADASKENQARDGGSEIGEAPHREGRGGEVDNGRR